MVPVVALTQFVRNVEDISDDGGYKFRFHCDRCNDGVESQYVSSSSNLLKTGLEVFMMFRPFGYGSRTAVDGIDRGLRGKEHDAAYEKAIGQALAHFTKCSLCGSWVDTHCWNAEVGLCEGCAPDAGEAAGVAASERRRMAQVAAAQAGEPVPGQFTCSVCSRESGGGRFCVNCGADSQTHACTACGASLTLGSRFCGGCGASA
jgi:hypothetical protein